MLECLLFVHTCVFPSLSFLRVFHVSRPGAFRPARFPSFGVIVVPFRLFNYLSAGFNQSGIGARNAGWPGPRRITTCAEDLSNGASGSTVGICVFIHASTSVCGFSAAAKLHCVNFHGHPFASNHCNASRCPPSAAFKHDCSFHM